MSWFNTSGIATLAKSTITHAQKAIDKALDIHDDYTKERDTRPAENGKSGAEVAEDDESFFAAFGLDEIHQLTETKKPRFSTDKNAQSMWGSFTGSFFESGSGGIERFANRENLAESYGGKPPVETIASQPKKVPYARGKHQTISLGQVTGHSCDEDEKYKMELAGCKISPGHRVRSSSESVLCLTGTANNQIEQLASAETFLRGDASANQTSVSTRVYKKNSILDDGMTTQCLTVEKKVDNVILLNLAIQQVVDEPCLVKDNVPDNIACEGAQESFLKHEDECDDDSKKSIFQMVSPSMISTEKGSCSSTGKSVDGLFPLVDLRACSTSVCSVSSSSTIGDSSTTLDESVSTLSALSERDGHSSATITPDLFTDMTEYSLPTGMSTSWDIANMPQDVDNEYARKNVFSSEILQMHIPSSSEFSSSCKTEVTPTLKAFEVVEPSFREKPVVTETAESCLETTGFVCYTLEVAIEKEQPKSALRASSPHSTNSSTSSAAERSDPAKTVESEQYSGHTSGDEIETTTSSDIEIISSPGGGGESGCDRAGSLSPIKQSSLWRRNVPTCAGLDGSAHQVTSSIRSQSPASDTSSTKDSVPAQYGFSPFRPDFLFSSSGCGSGKVQHQRNRSEASSDESEGSQAKIEALVKKLSEVTTILEAREVKVLELANDNLELRDRSKILKTLLQKAEEVRLADNRDVNVLTKEFTEKLSSTEKKLQQAVKEKDCLKLELLKANQEISTRVNFAELEEIKKEKDTQIVELMQEGEKLSKQLLGYSNNVKKLRGKEKDNDAHIKQQRAKLEEQSRELDRIRKALGAKEEVEKNQIELIRQLTSTVQKYEKDLADMKITLDDAQEKQCSINVAMDSAYKELDELHRKNCESDTKVQEAVLSAEMLAKEELKSCLEHEQLESRLQQENLMIQIEDLRVTQICNDEQASRREDALRQEIANLQKRLQETEGRNEDLNQNVSAATRPLLRQIDNLQSTLNIQTTTWERVERNLIDKLNEAQNQLAYAIEKELVATERYAEISSKVASLEAHCSLMRKERATLNTQLTSLNEELHIARESKSKDSMYSETVKQSFAEEMFKLKREMGMLELQLDIEKTAVVAEKRKNIFLSEQLKEKIASFESSRHSSPSPLANISMRDSFSEQFPSGWCQEQTYDSSSGVSGMPSTRMNVYESLRSGNTGTFVDSLQSQLKLRDGDIFQLQENINQLERVRQSMTEELVKLTVHNEELEANSFSLKEQARQHEDMQQKYNALLQMYGEISEEADELRLDLQDVKDMYKAQIDELMKRNH